MRTPVVFIIFNRADTARRVLAAIRQARPSRLFVIADGPRPHRVGEEQRCLEARAVIEEIDWECEVTTDFSDVNLGCRKRISSGLDRVFATVEEAIILEDDCLPEPSFFGYCEELLDRYRDDTRVMHIAGVNYLFGQFQERLTRYSYYFSRYNHCGAWATWRRAWTLYDSDMNCWPELHKSGQLADILAGDEWAVRYWENAFQQVFDRRTDSWSFVWTFSCWINNGLTILPSVNLISNIGFNEQGAHTINKRSRFANMKTAPISLPLSNPIFMIRDIKADRYIQRHNFKDGIFIRLARKMLRYYVQRSQRS